MNSNPSIVLDGQSLTIEQIARIARDPTIRVELSDEAVARVRVSREQIEKIVKDYFDALDKPGSKLAHVYGVTTGFGEFKNEPVPPDQLVELQKNILLSHAAGAGDSSSDVDPHSYFPADVVRATLAIRLNTLLKGHSGVRVEMVQCILAMLNRGIVPLVPTRGSVGSSGDLCPLAHLFVVLLGKGRYYMVRSPDDVLRPFERSQLKDAAQLGSDLGVAPLAPSYKEGLALTNGATFSAAMLAIATHDAEAAANVADLATAMTLEAICGRTRAFDPAVHEVRNLRGQVASASNIRVLLAGSDLADRAQALQDAYSIRCSPQVHGSARDTIAFAKMVSLAEINAATDNPLFFPKLTRRPTDIQSRLDRGDDENELGDEAAFSAGNFHGQPVALAADFLAIAVAELADIAERRTQVLLDRHHNRNLPPNLIPRRGVNSGLMLVQYTSAGIVSENKVLTHPASVDSIPTSGNSEDHNSMATIAGRKLRTVVANTQAVLAINLLVASQAIDWRVGMNISPNAATTTQNVITDVADKLQAAEEEAKSFESSTAASEIESIASRLGVGTGAAYRAIRGKVPTLHRDRVLSDDIRAVRRMIETGAIVATIAAASVALEPISPLRS